MTVLIPRLNGAQAAERFAEIKGHMTKGSSPAQLVRVELDGTVPNATGGTAPTLQDVTRWRNNVVRCMHDAGCLEGAILGGSTTQALYSRDLGRSLEEVIKPSRSDAAHDGTWSYLSLMLFPDLVARRWGMDTDGNLSTDRWIGAQLGRDRNYLKLSWRNWTVLGEVMDEAIVPLGEDEFVALLERTALARNPRLVRIAAREIISLDPAHEIARSGYARELMKRLTFQTGPLLLDLLDDQELAALVKIQAEVTLSSFAQPRRAASN